MQVPLESVDWSQRQGVSTSAPLYWMCSGGKERIDLRQAPAHQWSRFYATVSDVEALLSAVRLEDRLMADIRAGNTSVLDPVRLGSLYERIGLALRSPHAPEMVLQGETLARAFLLAYHAMVKAAELIA
jgi:hypothetical protein